MESETEGTPRRRAAPIVGAVVFFVALWLVTFYATGLLWWDAPDRYGARVPRPAPLVTGVPVADANPPAAESGASSESSGSVMGGESDASR